MKNSDNLSDGLRQVIADLLDNPDFSYRAEAAEKLGECGDSACVPFLIEALRDDNWNVVNKAIYALLEHSDKRAIAPLVSLLLDDSKEWLRISAADVLGEIGDEGVIGALQEVMSSPDEDLQSYAKDAVLKLKSIQSASIGTK